MRARSRERGFTLIEMLIVVGIIILLASLVFIGLGKIQLKARETVCQQNLRHLCSGVMEYANFVNGGRFPGFDFQPGGQYANSRSADEWVWALGLVGGDHPYWGDQFGEQTKILPPVASSPVLRCPSDTHYVVNGQRALTSYYAPPVLSDRVLSSIIRRSESPVFFEADPLNLSGNCGCRFHVQNPPNSAETYHDGGSNCALLDGSVRWISTKRERAITSYNEGNKVVCYYLYLSDGRELKYPSGN